MPARGRYTQIQQVLVLQLLLEVSYCLHMQRLLAHPWGRASVCLAASSQACQTILALGIDW